MLNSSQQMCKMTFKGQNISPGIKRFTNTSNTNLKKKMHNKKIIGNRIKGEAWSMPAYN